MEVITKKYKCTRCDKEVVPELKQVNGMHTCYNKKFVAFCPECERDDYLVELEEKENREFGVLVQEYWEESNKNKLVVCLVGLASLIVIPLVLGVVFLVLKFVFYLILFLFKIILWGIGL